MISERSVRFTMVKTLVSRVVARSSALHPGARGGAGGGAPRRTGQALVEFALIAPLLVLILGMIVDFGFGFSTAMDVVKTAESAALSGAGKNLPDSAVKSLTTALLRSHRLNPALATITVTHPIVESLDTVRVDIAYNFVPFTPPIQAALGPTYKLRFGAVYAKSL